jgi:hypothetical protein
VPAHGSARAPRGQPPSCCQRPPMRPLSSRSTRPITAAKSLAIKSPPTRQSRRNLSSQSVPGDCFISSSSWSHLFPHTVRASGVRRRSGDAMRREMLLRQRPRDGHPTAVSWKGARRSDSCSACHSEPCRERLGQQWPCRSAYVQIGPWSSVRLLHAGCTAGSHRDGAPAMCAMQTSGSSQDLDQSEYCVLPAVRMLEAARRQWRFLVAMARDPDAFKVGRVVDGDQVDPQWHPAAVDRWAGIEVAHPLGKHRLRRAAEERRGRVLE